MRETLNKLEYDQISSASRMDATPDIFERVIIGCLISCQPAHTAKIAGQAYEETFGTPRNLFAYSILRNAALSGSPLGFETAIAAIQQAPGSLEHFHSHEDIRCFIEGCIEAGQPHTSWPSYLKQLQLAYTRRKLLTAFDDATVSALRADSAELAAADAIAKVIETAGEIRRNSLHNDDKLSGAVDRWLERYCSEDGACIPYPQDKLNMAGGYRDGQVIVVAAPTGGKKSWTVLDWAVDGAKNHNRSARIYSLEMDENDIIDRMIAMENHLDLTQVVNRKYSAVDMENWAEELAQLDISIIDHRISPGRIISDIASMSKEDRPKNIVVDHLDLFSWKEGNEVNALKGALASFKDAAKEYGVTFFLVSQFRRPRNDDEAQYPHMGMLKGGSAIEQISDMIVFINTEVDRSYDGDEEISYMSIPKLRQGKKPPKFRVRFLKNFKFR